MVSFRLELVIFSTKRHDPGLGSSAAEPGHTVGLEPGTIHHMAGLEGSTLRGLQPHLGGIGSDGLHPTIGDDLTSAFLQAPDQAFAHLGVVDDAGFGNVYGPGCPERPVPTP